MDCPNGTCNSSMLLQAAVLKRAAQLPLPAYKPEREEHVNEILDAHEALAKGVER